MLDTDYLSATEAKLRAMQQHIDPAGQRLLDSALASLTMAQELSSRPEPRPGGFVTENCQDPGCEYCLSEQEADPEPDALDLVEPATVIIDRLVERLKLCGDTESLALATEGLTLLRVTLGDYHDTGDPGHAMPTLTIQVPGVGTFTATEDRPA
jgi:hypothetical protein